MNILRKKIQNTLALSLIRGLVRIFLFMLIVSCNSSPTSKNNVAGSEDATLINPTSMNHNPELSTLQNTAGNDEKSLVLFVEQQWTGNPKQINISDPDFQFATQEAQAQGNCKEPNRMFSFTSLELNDPSIILKISQKTPSELHIITLQVQANIPDLSAWLNSQQMMQSGLYGSSAANFCSTKATYSISIPSIQKVVPPVTIKNKSYQAPTTTQIQNTTPTLASSKPTLVQTTTQSDSEGDSTISDSSSATDSADDTTSYDPTATDSENTIEVTDSGVDSTTDSSLTLSSSDSSDTATSSVGTKTAATNATLLRPLLQLTDPNVVGIPFVFASQDHLPVSCSVVPPNRTWQYTWIQIVPNSILTFIQKDTAGILHKVTTSAIATDYIDLNVWLGNFANSQIAKNLAWIGDGSSINWCDTKADFAVSLQQIGTPVANQSTSMSIIQAITQAQTELQSFSNSSKINALRVQSILQSTPTASITIKPAAVVTSTSALFQFSCDQNCTYQAQWDSNSFANVSSPITISSLSNGSHTIQVQAINALGKISPPVSYTWLIDTTLISVSFQAQPAAVTNQSVAIFSFSCNKPCTLQKNLDNTTWDTLTTVASTDPVTQSITLTGSGVIQPHTLAVKALDTHQFASTSIVNWTYDTVLPNPRVAASPPDQYTTNTSIVFSLATDKPSLFATQFDHGGYSVLNNSMYATTLTISYNSLTNTNHELDFKVRDLAGNVGTNTYSWNVDTTSAVVAIKPNYPYVTNSTTQSLSISCNKPCTLKRNLDTTTWSALTTVATLTPFTDKMVNLAQAGQTGQMHNYVVDAQDLEGHVTTNTYSWIIDTTPPHLTVNADPISIITASTSATMTLTSDELVNFMTQLDRGSWSTLNSTPATTATLSLASLASSIHTFSVSATDLAGNFQTATYSWTVDTTVPKLTLTPSSRNPITNSTNISFVYSCTKPVTFQKSIDNGAWRQMVPAAPQSVGSGLIEALSSVLTPSITDTLTNLTANGQAGQLHTYEVMVTDTVGNSATATYSWTIDTTPPHATISVTPSNQYTAVTSAVMTITTDEPAMIESKLDSAGFSLLSGSYISTYVQTLPSLTSSAHAYYVRTTDLVGNSNTTSYVWYVETNQPTLTISANPTGRITNSSSATMTVSCNKVCNMQTSMDNNTWNSLPNSTPTSVYTDYVYSLFSTNQTGQAYTYYASATDMEGNSVTSSYTWTVDTNAPQLSITPPTANYYTTSSSALMTITSNEPAIIESNINGNAYHLLTQATSIGSLVTYSFTNSMTELLTNLPAAANTYNVRVTDRAGNQQFASYTWAYDNTLPLLTVNAAPVIPLNHISTSTSEMMTLTCSKSCTMLRQLNNSVSWVILTNTFSTDSYNDFINTQPGQNVYTVKATDLEGNVVTYTNTWTVPATGP